MRVLAFVIVSFGLVSSARAALTPTAESLRRIAAITQSSDVYNELGPSLSVTSITDRGNGTYSVLAGSCALNVTVEPILSDPPQMVPPLRVSVGRVVCLPQ